MTIEYRIMHPTEARAVHDFFLTAYTANPDEGRLNYRAWQSLPQQHKQTYVAVAPDAQILATVVTWYRQVRDTGGTPQRVGHLSHVVTRASARRQGHASCLMDRAIAAMELDGCTWSSLLASSAPGRALYERYGWGSRAMSFWRGRVTGDHRCVPAPGYQVRRYDPTQEPAGWAPLATIYADYNARRSLTVVRDQPYWDTFTAAQLAHGLHAGRVAILTAHHPIRMGDPCGYVLLHVHDTAFVVSEIGVRSGDEAAISALLAAVAEVLKQRGVLEGDWLLPQTPEIRAPLESLCGATLQHVDTDFIMVRPIGRGVTIDQVGAIFTAPGAIWWRLDMI